MALWTIVAVALPDILEPWGPPPRCPSLLNKEHPTITETKPRFCVGPWRGGIESSSYQATRKEETGHKGRKLASLSPMILQRRSYLPASPRGGLGNPDPLESGMMMPRRGGITGLTAFARCAGLGRPSSPAFPLTPARFSLPEACFAQDDGSPPPSGWSNFGLLAMRASFSSAPRAASASDKLEIGSPCAGLA
jgi:hypothetical protein